ALKNPDEWMKELELIYQSAQNEQAMFVNRSGQRTIHADPHAGNIFVDFNAATGKPEIIYIDTGNVITRNTKETLQDVGLSLNMMIGNSRGIAESMLDGAILPRGTNKAQITERFAKLLDERLYKADVNLKNTQYTQNTINQIMKELNIIPNSSNSNLMKATLQRVETARGIRAICGNTGNEKIANIKDLGIALIKAFKTDPKEAWKTLKPILKWALQNKDQAMVTFFQMIIKNAEVKGTV
ncbi:MAG: AarF/UbiB family protein, partial [Candidatus Gastranaerophilales bacterium]|nr:AarF/UbiB family protein [Candidatus Gastranaerophilales bacterium]